MRTLPAIELDVPIQSAWAWLVDGLCLLASASMACWWWQAGDTVPAETLRNALLLIGVLAVLLASRARRCEPCHLRWDGQQWFGGPVQGGSIESLPVGRLSVMLDLQLAMVLRFDPECPDPMRSARWLVARRGAMAASWHLLRCAVFNQPVLGTGNAGHGVEARR